MIKHELQNDARLLSENKALSNILDSLEADIVARFPSTPDDGLVALKRDYEAIQSLRGAISSRLLDLLETA